MSQARKGKGGGGDDSQNRSVKRKLVQNITDISKNFFARDCSGGVQVTLSRSQVDTYHYYRSNLVTTAASDDLTDMSLICVKIGPY